MHNNWTPSTRKQNERRAFNKNEKQLREPKMRGKVYQTLDIFHIFFGVFDMRWKHSFTHSPKYKTGTLNLPSSFPLAMRLVATSLIVLCDAPEDRIAATRQALKSRGDPNKFNKMVYQGIGQLLCVYRCFITEIECDEGTHDRLVTKLWLN